jgi:hypothetical protein
MLAAVLCASAIYIGVAVGVIAGKLLTYEPPDHRYGWDKEQIWDP